jgi:hypothetical protein
MAWHFQAEKMNEQIAAQHAWASVVASLEVFTLLIAARHFIFDELKGRRFLHWGTLIAALLVTKYGGPWIPAALWPL